MPEAEREEEGRRESRRMAYLIGTKMLVNNKKHLKRKDSVFNKGC